MRHYFTTNRMAKIKMADNTNVNDNVELQLTGERSKWYNNIKEMSVLL